MLETGINVKRLQSPSGVGLFAALTAGIVILCVSFGFSSYLRLSTLQEILLPLAACFVGVVMLGNVVVPVLQRLKAGQVIREDGPQAHLKKAGTPTMGGIFILPVGVILAVILSNFNSDVIAASLVTLAYGAMGWFDDWQILHYKSNKGISPTAKLGLQALVAACFCGWLAFNHSDNLITNINLPWQLVLPIGILFWPLAMFVLIATTNSTNLTDGLDGLAGGTGSIALVGLSLLIGYEHPELAIFCACMSGSYLGFLWHNRNPARVFMGNTGSLALGGALASTAILSNSLWCLFVVGAIFIWESISVITQVGYFKYTKSSTGIGKRLFKMAPFHHHLELSGWKETQVVGAFYLVGMLLVLLSISLKLM